MAVPTTLIDRWKLGVLPKLWEDAQTFLADKLGNLERVMSVLQRQAEYPAASLEARVVCSAITNITATTPADITGISWTYKPMVDMTILAIGTFDVQCTLFGAVTNYFLGTLETNGAPASNNAVWSASALNARAHQTVTWLVSLKSGTSYTLKMRGAVTNVLNNYQVNPTHSGLVILKVPNVFKLS